MNLIRNILLFVFTSIFISSCELRCSVGNADNPKGDAVVKDGARIYNGIVLNTNGVKVEKAYLILGNGEAVPETNIIDFTQPVHLKLTILEGWKEDSGKVNLGTSERIFTEKGEVLLDEKDLFEKYPEGISAADAKKITVTAKIIIKQKMEPLTTFNVAFRVWDKNSNSQIEGSYKLYSK